MSLPLQKFREVIFQMLYSYDIGKPDDDEIVTLLMKELAVTKKAVKTAQERVKQIIAKQAEIDTMITKTSTSYEFSRIQTIERNILRLSIYELFFDDSIPPKVSIAEAIRLARKFGTPESASFVNAVLDNLYKSSMGEKTNNQEIVQTYDALLKSEEMAKKAIENNPHDSD
jgi:transcription antitermination protein NusB